MANVGVKIFILCVFINQIYEGASNFDDELFDKMLDLLEKSDYNRCSLNSTRPNFLPTDISTDVDKKVRFQDQCVNAHNAIRAKLKLTEFASDSSFLELASKRAEQISHKFAHFDIPIGIVAESIASTSGKKDCDFFVNELWYKSNFHKIPIESKIYSKIGCAVHYVDSTSYACCLYVA